MDYEGVREIFLYGDSNESYCICIAVPDPAKVMEIAKRLQVEGEFSEVCNNQKVRAAFLSEMNAIGKEKGLKGF